MRRPFAREDQPASELWLIVGASSERLDDIEGRAGGVITRSVLSPKYDPSPSRADIQMTRAIVDIATPLGISVHDHIIVGRGGHASLKGMRFDLTPAWLPRPNLSLLDKLVCMAYN